MPSVLDRQLVVVTGKGGVGKTTVSAALGLLAARHGRRTIVVEVGEQHRLPDLFGREPRLHREIELQPGLWTISIDPHQALLEWIEKQALGRLPARILGSSHTFAQFVGAAPGAREVVTVGKAWDLGHGDRGRPRAAYDLVVLDAPSTGHALALVRAPRTFASIARVGPIGTYAARIADFLGDAEGSCYVAVAQGTEMATTETLELETRLREQLDRGLEAVIVNGVLPRRFSGLELGEVEAAGAAAVGKAAEPVCAAVRAARFVAAHAAAEQSQVARLRRRGFDVTTLPFVFAADPGAAAARHAADALERRWS